MTRTIAIAAAAAIAGLLAATWYLSMRGGGDQFAACRASAIAGGAGSVGGPFTLVNGAGETVTDADVITKPSLLYFGYTFCPDVCPFDVTRNADAVDILQDQGIDVQPVFISVDPERDTPKQLAEYAVYMHDDMIALSGTPEQVKEAAAAYRVIYSKQDGDDEFYLVNHTTFTYLVLPEHGFVEFFRRDTTPEAMAERTACFVDAA